MREVKYYEAWDESEFLDCDECIYYERQAVEKMAEVSECYDFLDENGERFIAPLTLEIEDWLGWLSNAVEHCYYVKVNRILPQASVEFIDREWGYCIAPKDFHNETGLFKYDYFKNEWIKVGE